MKFQLKRYDIGSLFPGHVEENGGFSQAAMYAAIDKLAKELQGWYSYEIDHRDGVYPIMQYWISFYDKGKYHLTDAYIEINEASKTVEIEVE